MMVVKRTNFSIFAAVFVAVMGVGVACGQQGNPSSATNPFWGSVTAKVAGDGPVRLTLDDAIRRGFENNLGLREAERGEVVLKGQELEALQQFLPTIAVSGGVSVHEYNLAALGFGPGFAKKISGVFPGGFSGVSLITKSDVTQGQVSYNQTLFSGPVIGGYRAVRAAEDSARAQKNSARGQVVQQVATVYLAILADQAQVENAKAQLEADRILVEKAKAQHAAGTAGNLDELRANVQYEQQQQELIAAENQLEKQEILLKREIGIAPGAAIELTDATPYHELEASPLESLRAQAYQSRQDYLNLVAQERESQIIWKARREERLPTLSFYGNYGVTGVTGVGYHGTLVAMGKLNIPIFREATQRGDTEVARAEVDGVQMQLADLRVHIDAQIRSAQMDVDASRQLVEVARSNVELATEALADENDRYAAGVDDTLPVVRAQATLAAAKSNLVASEYQYNVAKLVLARATGMIELQYRKYLGE
jgi:outer membrane protein TolC